MKYKLVVLGLVVLLAGGLWSKRDKVEVLGATSPGDCALLKKGDLDCDGKVSIADFAIWKKYFLEMRNGPTGGPRLTSGALKCGWCGTECVPAGSEKACLDVMPPAGMKCVASGGKCVTVSDLRVTSGLQPTATAAPPLPRTTMQPTATLAPPPLESCGGQCIDNNDCTSGYCYKSGVGIYATGGSGVCRDKNCPGTVDCLCSLVTKAPTATPAPPSL